MRPLLQTIFSPHLSNLTNNHENKSKALAVAALMVKVRPMPRDFFDPTPEQQNVVPQSADRQSRAATAR
jgi:hypothetical protein